MKVPYWNELSIEKIWVKAILIKGFLDYMPCDWTTARKVNRDFFYCILCTLAKGWVTALVDECREQRYQKRKMKQDVPTGNRIALSSEWAQMLLQHNF